MTALLILIFLGCMRVAEKNKYIQWMDLKTKINNIFLFLKMNKIGTTFSRVHIKTK